MNKETSVAVEHFVPNIEAVEPAQWPGGSVHPEVHIHAKLKSQFCIWTVQFQDYSNAPPNICDFAVHIQNILSLLETKNKVKRLCKDHCEVCLIIPCQDTYCTCTCNKNISFMFLCFAFPFKKHSDYVRIKVLKFSLCNNSSYSWHYLWSLDNNLIQVHSFSSLLNFRISYWWNSHFNLVLL